MRKILLALTFLGVLLVPVAQVEALAPPAPIVTMTQLVHLSDVAPLVVPDNTFTIPNSSVGPNAGQTMILMGTYAPYSTGDWVITITTNPWQGSIPAYLDGEGTWYAAIDPTIFSPDDIAVVMITVATRNNVNVKKSPSLATLLIGNWNP